MPCGHGSTSRSILGFALVILFSRSAYRKWNPFEEILHGVTCVGKCTL